MLKTGLAELKKVVFFFHAMVPTQLKLELLHVTLMVSKKNTFSPFTTNFDKVPLFLLALKFLTSQSSFATKKREE